MGAPAETLRALWSPYWYDMDQALRVGREEEMVFFAPTPPGALGQGFSLQFHCGFPEESVHWRETTILRIEHPDWGVLRSVATGLEYTFELADGRRVVADSEGESGAGIEPEDGEQIWVNDTDSFAPGYAALSEGVVLPTTWDLAVSVRVGGPSRRRQRPSKWFRQHS